MYIPDCRTDKNYNQKMLNKRDKDLLSGYDHGVSSVLNMFENLEIYLSDMEIDGEDINLVHLLNNHPNILDAFVNCAKDYAEMFRNEMIVSLLDEEWANEENNKNNEQNE